MGKAERNKTEKAEAEKRRIAAYMDMTSLTTLYVAAKTLSTQEFDHLFQTEHERLLMQGFTKKEVDACLTSFAGAIQALQLGGSNDKS